MLNSPKVLYKAALLVAVLYLVCWAALGLYARPHSDDFIAMKQAGTETVAGYVSTVYNTWSGRYAPALLAYVAVQAGLMSVYPYLSMVWLGVLYICFLWMAKQLRLFGMGAWATALGFLLLAVVSVAEPHGAWYWFSASATYTFSTCLFVCLVAMFVQLRKQATRWLCALVLVVLFLLCGCHEPALLCTGGWLLWMWTVQRKQWPAWVAAFVALVYMCAAALVVFAPGNAVRSGYGSAPSWAASLAGTAFHGISVLYQLAVQPAVWILFAALYLVYGKAWLRKLIWPIGIVFLSMLPILYLSAGSLPERAINFYQLFLLICVLSIPAVYALPAKKPTQTQWQWAFCGFVLAIICSDKTAVLAKNLVAAPIHAVGYALPKAEGGEIKITEDEKRRLRANWIKENRPNSRKMMSEWMLEGPIFLEPSDK